MLLPPAASIEAAPKFGSWASPPLERGGEDGLVGTSPPPPSPDTSLSAVVVMRLKYSFEGSMVRVGQLVGGGVFVVIVEDKIGQVRACFLILYVGIGRIIISFLFLCLITRTRSVT